MNEADENAIKIAYQNDIARICNLLADASEGWANLSEHADHKDLKVLGLRVSIVMDIAVQGLKKISEDFGGDDGSS